MSRACQHCGLLSPDETLRCDCGYDFQSLTVERSYLVPRVPEKASEIEAQLDSLGTSPRIGVFFLVIIALVAVIGWPEQGDRTLYAVPLLWVCWSLYRALHDSRSREQLTRQPASPDESPDGLVRTGPGQYVVPRSLAVVTAATDSIAVDLVVWGPTLRNVGREGLSPEQVIGRLARSLKDGGALMPDNFVQHDAFVQFLHQFLQRELPGRGGLLAAARRQKDGWVSYIDSRVLDWPDWRAEAEPSVEDVFGAFQVQGGLIVEGSYWRNPAHRLLSDKGLFQLEYALRERLKAEIAARHAFRQAGSVASERVM
jgi:hypothetical protein